MLGKLEFEQIYQDGYKILKLMLHDEENGKPSYLRQLSKETGIPIGTVRTRIKILVKNGLITKDEDLRGRKRFLHVTAVGKQAVVLMSPREGSTPELIKENIEKILSAPGHETIPIENIIKLVKKIRSHADDIVIVDHALTKLSTIISQELKGGSHRVYDVPALREILIQMPPIELAGVQSERVVRLLAEMIRTTRTYTNWLKERPELVDGLVNLVEQDGQIGIDALHVMKELLTPKGKVYDAVFSEMIEVIWRYVDSQSDRSIITMTNAPIDVLKAWNNTLTPDQKKQLDDIINQIQIDEKGEYYRNIKVGKKTKRQSLDKQRSIALEQTILEITT